MKDESPGCFSILGVLAILTVGYAIIVSIPLWFWILLAVLIVASVAGLIFYLYKDGDLTTQKKQPIRRGRHAVSSPLKQTKKNLPSSEETLVDSKLSQPEPIEISKRLRAPELWTINDLIEPIKSNDPELHVSIDEENRLLQFSYAHVQLQKQLENDERLLGSLLNSTIDLSNALQKNGVRDLTVQILYTWYGDPIISVFNGIITQMEIDPNKKFENLRRFGTTKWDKEKVDTPFFSDKIKLLDNMKDVDKLDGRGFELFMGKLLENSGYLNVKVTVTSGDQGIDVTAEYDNKKIGIQCKHFKGTVGNKAVQELFAGLAFYHLDKGIVVTNSTFTQSAIELAKATSIELWDRTKLSHLIADCPNTDDTKS